MSSLVIERTDRPTDGPNDGHVQSNIPPLLRIGHNNKLTSSKVDKLHFKKRKDGQAHLRYLVNVKTLFSYLTTVEDNN